MLLFARGENAMHLTGRAGLITASKAFTVSALLSEHF
jgi:hypothetical protein